MMKGIIQVEIFFFTNFFNNRDISINICSIEYNNIFFSFDPLGNDITFLYNAFVFTRFDLGNLSKYFNVCKGFHVGLACTLFLKEI